MLTFEQFQASRTWCPDLPAVLTNDNWGDPNNGTPCGWLYLGALYIEDTSASHWPPQCRAEGRWYLILGRDERITDDLESLERDLYAYATSEGYDAPQTSDELTREYATWNERNGLALGSADEHLFDEDLTAAQLAWLRNFSERWEQVCKREDEDAAIERRARDEGLLR
jgi:hypothetical protein